jgi:hypothetical protein
MMAMRVTEGWLPRFVRGAQKLHAISSRQTLRRYALWASVFVFSAGLLLSIRHLPDSLALNHPHYLLYIAAIGVPLRILLNTAEMKLNAHIVGADLNWAQATQIGLVSSAANMLPLPGGPLVRVAALKKAGATLVESSVTTALLGVNWLGLAFFLSGACIVEEHVAAGYAFLSIGALGIVGSSLGIFKHCKSWLLTGAALATKLAGIVVVVLRFIWAFAALGIVLSAADAAVFSVAGVAGSAASIVPAGLGVNESVAALLAPLASVPPAAAYLAATLNRAVALPVLMLATCVIAFRRNGRPCTT